MNYFDESWALWVEMSFEKLYCEFALIHIYGFIRGEAQDEDLDACFEGGRDLLIVVDRLF